VRRLIADQLYWGSNPYQVSVQFIKEIHMKVQLGSKTYSICWHHVRDNEVNQATECTIAEVIDGKRAEELIATGTAHCSFLDCYDKNTGRKISLERALLNHIPDPINPAAPWIPLFSKEDRVLVWETYFKMRGGKW
jgi:hypothetical protein